MSDYEYPEPPIELPVGTWTGYPVIIDFLTRRGEMQVSSIEYNTNFIMGHCGFFSFCFFSAVYIIFWEGIIMRRLHKNKLLLLALVSVSFQMASCCTSIHRYNINDYRGKWAGPGNVLTLLAIIPLNGNYLSLLFPHMPKTRMAGWAFWFCLNVVAAIVGEVNIDEMENPFVHIRLILGMSWAFSLICLNVGHYKIKRDDIRLDPSILKKTELLTLFKVLILINIGIFVIMILSILLASNCAAGSSFGLMTIMSAFVGRMDHVQKGLCSDGEIEYPEEEEADKDKGEDD